MADSQRKRGKPQRLSPFLIELPPENFRMGDSLDRDEDSRRSGKVDGMRFTAAFLGIVLGISAAVSLKNPSRSQGSIGEADRRQDVVRLEDRWLQNEGDPEVLGTILAAGFVHAFPPGFVTKDQQLRYVRKTELIETSAKAFRGPENATRWT